MEMISREQTGVPPEKEVYQLAFPTKPYPYISHGLPFPEACAHHVSGTFNASHVYVVASGSLSRDTDQVQRLQDALGKNMVGIRTGMQPHTLWSECLQVTAECRRTQADCIVTLGAGSLTDASKIISLALANNAETFEDLYKLTSDHLTPANGATIKGAVVPIISIPTSLSGGEYSDSAGGTHDETHRKHSFRNGAHGPSLVILDPALTTTTPARFWLSTGIRAVDHCVESMCSLESTPDSNADAGRGLLLLLSGLLKSKSEPANLEARFKCQMGVIEAMKGVFQHHVPMGASHGIGHQLGPLGVGHGETSCINLPAVCRYNSPVNAGQQANVLEILWSEPEVAAVLHNRSLEKGKDDLCNVLDALIRELGQPRSLKEVGVGEDMFELLAKNSLEDRWCATNPRPLTKTSQVMEILEMIKG